MDLSESEFTCLINEQMFGGRKEYDSEIAAEIYEPAFIIDYQWSPKSDYLWLVIDPFGPESNDHIDCCSASLN
jgi:hypothetical protein